MRVSPLLLPLVALALVAPAAGAQQDLRSPDTREAAAQTLHTSRTTTDSPRYQGALAQQQYYSSYGEPTPIPSRSAAPDDDSPWLTIGLGVGLIALVAGAIALAVRTRRRTPRVRVA